jgi:predicted P-loop ATPase
MRDLSIAYGNSCFAKTWPNKTVTWTDLCSRLSVTIRTTESVEEYPKLKKSDREKIKDKGGFVGGQLKNNRRKIETVVCRSMLTMDLDQAEVGFIERFCTTCKFAAALYTTHGHIPEKPRVRIIIPFTRDTSVDEYAAIARYYAAEWGIDQFDECSYRPNQLMYWPTTPANGEYIFKRIDGAWLDPDVYLAAHPNWKECSLLPTSSRESAVREASQKPQDDPLGKSGIVGAFCRSYTLESAIEAFLSDLYAPSVMAGRYDYIPADSSAGVVIYDDKYAYSHHASDPAYGKLLNAFDLVRIHKFGDDDEKSSYKNMCDFALKDEAVASLLLEERRQSASEDFMPGENWASRLTRTKAGDVENTLGNLLLIMKNDEALSQIRYNRLANQIYAEDLPWAHTHPAWRDADTAQLVAYVDTNYGEFSARNYELALTKVSDDRAYHPVREYLMALEWDGIPRDETVFIDFLGAEDTPYVRAVTRKTLAAGAGRILAPGIKFDTIPVIIGGQGIGKSTMLAKLGKQWYSDSLSISDMKDKTAPEKLQGNWLLELSELAGIKKMDVETVKSFASRVDDKYRPSYGRVVESHPRQCIIIGSTNSDGGFLRDVTGNRRFWPINVTGEGTRRPWDITEYEVDQIWAEAVANFNAGEELFLKGDVAEAAADAQRDAMETDDREGLVAAFLDTLLPEDWDTTDIYRRQEFFRDPDDPTRPVGTVRRTQVSNIEIWCECYGRSRDSIKKSDSYEIEAILRSIGNWEKYSGNKTGKRIIPLYGVQRVYLRSE